MEILNVFNIGSQLTITTSVVESANSGLESANFSADSNADPTKVGVCVQALSRIHSSSSG